MSPSSPWSERGVCPSNRTLEAGSVQFTLLPLLVTFEHRPVMEEPFTDTTSDVENEKLVRTTCAVD